MDKYKKTLDRLVKKTNVIKNKHKKFYKAMLLAIILVIVGIILKRDKDNIIRSISSLKEFYNKKGEATDSGESVIKGLTKIVLDFDKTTFNMGLLTTFILIRLVSMVKDIAKTYKLFTDDSTTKDRETAIIDGVLSLITAIISEKIMKLI